MLWRDGGAVAPRPAPIFEARAAARACKLSRKGPCHRPMPETRTADLAASVIITLWHVPSQRFDVTAAGHLTEPACRGSARPRKHMLHRPSSHLSTHLTTHLSTSTCFLSLARRRLCELQALNCTLEWGLLGYRDTWRRGPSSILLRMLSEARSRFTAGQVTTCTHGSHLRTSSGYCSVKSVPEQGQACFCLDCANL